MNTISIVAENLIGAYSKMTFKPCKFGCDILVEVRQTAAGWRPFEEAGNMHDCPKSPYNQQNRNNKPKQQMIEPTEQEWKNLQQEKDDHGNETVYDSPPKQEFVDHTAGTKGYFKAFTAITVRELNEVANSWLQMQNVRFKQWGQLQVTEDGFAIALYYEELK
jgi:hypothetical protein